MNVAVDSLGAGVHEKVLIVMEGRAAGEALGPLVVSLGTWSRDWLKREISCAWLCGWSRC